MLASNNKIELPEPKRPEKVGHIKDSNYCHYYVIITYHTKNCFILKDKIQVWVEEGVLCLNEEKKEVTINVVSL